MFDVQLNIKVNIQTPKGKGAYSEAFAHIRLIGDKSWRQGSWRLMGAQDHRLPNFGHGNKHWVWASQSTGRISLLHNGKPWAWLDGFPAIPKSTSKGLAFAFRLPVGPSRTLPNGHFVGEWGVMQNARHGNLPTLDPNDGAFVNMIRSCTTDTGWRYDTSAGLSGAVGAIVGGGGIHGYLVLKRKEPNDARRWYIDIDAVGLGFMTPTLGASGSTESSFSQALCEVLAGPGIKLPFPAADFDGSVLILEGSGGLAIGKGKVGAGKSGSLTTYMFTGVRADSYSLADFSQVKAIVTAVSSATGGGKGQGASAAGIVYGGVARLRKGHG